MINKIKECERKVTEKQRYAEMCCAICLNWKKLIQIGSTNNSTWICEDCFKKEGYREVKNGK